MKPHMFFRTILLLAAITIAKCANSRLSTSSNEHQFDLSVDKVANLERQTLSDSLSWQQSTALNDSTLYDSSDPDGWNSDRFFN